MFKKTTLLILIVMFLNISQIAISAETRSPRLDNAFSTNEDFSITPNGLSEIYAVYTAYDNNFSSARITIELQKRNLLVFWKDITSWEITSTQDYYITERTYQVDNGTYRVNITYEFFNTDGTSEVIERTIKCTY